MAGLWAHHPKPRARQTHSSKGSQSQLRLNNKEHRTPPKTAARLSFTHHIREAPTTKSGQPPGKCRGHHGRPIRRRSVPQESLRRTPIPLLPLSRIFQRGLDLLRLRCLLGALSCFQIRHENRFL
ncbi:hypothetical protein Ahy_B03g062856 isoform D [Arachis hypogaea]|uniref:Uncharacterized protein n=1 Tax=Arachis hypogaea TaxID=3818 RepID=A0A444ZVL0_ARAHY|nr:hypothetical protein Ahy_B03g062856 isoform D [Arachis hypogaea]